MSIGVVESDGAARTAMIWGVDSKRCGIRSIAPVRYDHGNARELKRIVDFFRLPPGIVATAIKPQWTLWLQGQWAIPGSCASL